MPQSSKLNCNPGQLAAIRHGTGPMLVLAGPGSGKTFVITQRIRSLIEERGADPSSILVITFTRAAAAEMKERFLRLMEGKEGGNVNFGTFHAIYYHILKTTCHYHSGHILSEEEKREFLKTVLLLPSCPVQIGPDGKKQEPANRHLPGTAVTEAAMGELEDSILSQIGRYKNEGCPAEFKTATEEGELGEKEFLWVYRAYDRAVNAAGKLDFDDMVLKCRELFLSRPDILAAWQKKFKYILVDEFQDINAMQYQVLRMLALPENNLFIVGDDDQSIYAFRGAKPEIMLRFRQDYPQAGQIELSLNYRSSPEIVTAAGRLIGANRNRFSKQIRAVRPHGEKVRFLGFADRKSQNEAIAEELGRMGEEAARAAVIYRTNRDAGELAEILAERKIPFFMREKLKSPYKSRTAQDLMAYLSFALEGGRRKDFYRIMNKPVRYLARASVPEETVDLDALMYFYRSRPYMKEILRKFQLDVARIRRMDLFAAVNYIRKGMGYEDWLKRTALDEGRDVGELLAEADWFQRQAGQFDSLEQLREHIKGYEKQLEKASDRKQTGEGVNLLTMHASKGLEFDTVYLPDCNEGIVPHKKSMQGEQVEEERRMFYVAMTRARDRLTLSWVSGTKEEPGFLSRFLNDLGV